MESIDDDVVRDLARALGLADDAGKPDPEWLTEPLERLKKVLTDADARAALGRFVDGVIPGPGGTREGWHPLLWDGDAAPALGNLYLTLTESGGETTVGIAGEIGANVGTARLTATLQVPLLRIVGDNPEPALGGDSPDPIHLAVEIGPIGDAASFRVERIELALEISIGSSGVEFGPVVALRGIQVGGASLGDRVVDSTDPGGDTLDLVFALVQGLLAHAPEPLKSHLAPVLGIAGDGPRMPWIELGSDPDALRRWLVALVEDPARLGTWFAHAGRLLAGSPAADAPTPPGAGTLADPLRVSLLTNPVGLEITLAHAGGKLYPGVRFQAGPSVALSVEVVLVGIPLQSGIQVEPLPVARVGVASPPGLVTSGPIKVQRAFGGFGLVALQPAPILELTGVELDGQPPRTVDLTSPDQVGDFVVETFTGLLAQAIGVQARPLLALVGLEAPLAGVQPNSPWSGAGRPRLDVGRLLADPLGALAAYHAAALDAGWGPLLAELGTWIAPGVALEGVGTAEQPFSLEVAHAGPVHVEVVAWGPKADGLSLGLRVRLAEGAFAVGLTSEIVRFTVVGTPALHGLGDHRLTLSVSPPPVARAAGVTLSAASVSLGGRWQPGSMPAAVGQIAGVRVDSGAGPSAPFDVVWPPTGAAPSDAAIRSLLRVAAARWAGAPGVAMLGLAGFPDAGGLAGFPALGPGALPDPRASWRPWLGQVATGFDAAGVPSAVRWLTALSGVTSGAFLADRAAPRVLGSGAAADPWQMPVDGDGRVRLLAWLEPEGPDPTAALAAAASSPEALAAGLAAMRPHLAALRAGFDAVESGRLATGFRMLDELLEGGDGVVSEACQAPEPFTDGGVVTAAHGHAPEAAAAALAPHLSGGKVVLLSAPFREHTCWSAVVGGQSRHFDLRQAGIPPEQVDLRDVADVVPFYTVDIAGDPSTWAPALLRVLDRVIELAGGKVVLVAHSTAGIPALELARTAANRLVRVVTVATPHLPAEVPFLEDPSAALALRVAASLPLAASPLTQAIAEGVALLDGRAAAGNPAALPAAGLSLGTGDPPAIPVVSIRARAGSGLVAAAGAALQGLAPAVPAPTAIGLALEAALDGVTDSAEIRLDTRIRVDLGRVGLGGAPDVAARSVAVLFTAEGGDTWVLGGPGVAPGGGAWPARLRRATVRATWDGAALTTDVRLEDAALGGPLRTLHLADPETAPLLDLALQALSSAPGAAAALARLDALAILLPDKRLSADAFAALSADGAPYLAPRLRAAGLGPFAAGPFAITLHADRLQVAATTPAGSVDLALGPDLAVSGAARLTAGPATLAWTPDGATFAVAGWVPEFPVATGTIAADWPLRLGFSIAGAALLDAVVPIGNLLPPLDALFEGRAAIDPAATLLSPQSLDFILRQLSGALGHPSENGLILDPPGLVVSAFATPDGRTAVGLANAAGQRLGGVLGLSFSLAFGPGVAVTPAVTLSLGVPPAAGGALSDVAAEFTVDPAGVGLALKIGPSAEIRLLPTFGGWSSVSDAAVALLPRVLDAIDDAVPSSTAKTAILAVATAFDLYDGSFVGNEAGFEKLTQLDLDALRDDILQAIAALDGPLGLPGAFQAKPGRRLEWTFADAGVGIDVTLVLDWAAQVPVLEAAVDVSLRLGNANGPALETALLVLGLDTRLAQDFRAIASVGVSHPLGTGIASRLAFGARMDGSNPVPVLEIRPLGGWDAQSDPTDGPIVLRVLPTPQADVDLDALPGVLAFDVLLPLLVAVLERALGTAALPGGISLADLVDASGLFDAQRHLLPPSRPEVVLANLAAAFQVDIPIGGMRLAVGKVEADAVGVAVGGRVPVPIGAFELGLRFGQDAPPSGSGQPAERTALVLFRKSAGDWQFQPGLAARHFGLDVGGAEGTALVATDVVRLGRVDAFVSFDLNFGGSSPGATYRSAGLGVDGLAFSFGAIAGGGGSNAIASGILGNSGNQGDTAPPQPEFGLEVAHVAGGAALEGAGDSHFEIRFRGGTDPRKVRIGLHAAFGPLHIDEVGFEVSAVTDPTWVKVAIDGGVNVSGFAAQVDDLSLQIPLSKANGDPITSAGEWFDLVQVDLLGLAIAYSNNGVSIQGGLVKRTGADGSIGYAGMLQVRLQTLGAVAVGAWSKVREGDDEFDSFFLFGAVFVTISFPPYFTLQGLGGGFGVNRALIPPEKVEDTPSFPLLTVLDDPSAVDNPMSVLERIDTQLPARRGSLWFAAGMRGALFTVVDLAAVLYVAIDRGFEIGVLGVGRLEQPKGSPIVRVELALKARFSSAEGVLSIQAQLTENSWVLMPELRLTGGFALFIWFPRGKFVLTLGGYHPGFVPEPEYPIVPRLGFRATFGDALTLRGEVYFALTNSCVMAGGRLEATFDSGVIRAWFRAWADFLLCWDPFHYDIRIGIEIGAEIDLWLFSFTISLGARLWLVGPPLYGEVEVDLGPVTLRVEFGDSSALNPRPLHWDEFRDKFILSNDPAGLAAGAQPDKGLLPGPAGSEPPRGGPSDPWVFGAEFVMNTDSAVPVTAIAGPLGSVPVSADAVDFAPMAEKLVSVTHRLEIVRADGSIPPMDPLRMRITPRSGSFPEAVWRFYEKDQQPAAVENVTAVAGTTVEAVANALNPSAAVPIATLVDTADALPLPFATHGESWRGGWLGAATLGGQVKDALRAVQAEKLMGPSAPGRASLPFRHQPLTGSALAALADRRVQPKVASLTQGMELASPARGVARLPARAAPPEAGSIAPVLAGVARFEAAAAQAVVRTSARRFVGAPRVAAPRLEALPTMVVPSAAGPTLTKAAAPRRATPAGKARSIRSGLGQRVAEAGVVLAAGATHRWNLPGPTRSPGGWVVEVGGDAARVVAFDRGDVALLDVEGTGASRLALPENACTLVVSALGRLEHGVAWGRSAVTRAAAARPPCALGWSAEMPVFRVSQHRALGRGCRVRFDAPLGLEQILLPGRYLDAEDAVETELPPVDAVLVVADVAGSASEDEPVLHVSGVSAGPLVRFDASRRRAWLVPVSRGETKVAFQAPSGWRPSAVLGLFGRHEELTRSLHGSPLVGLLPPFALTADGSSRFRLFRGDR